MSLTLLAMAALAAASHDGRADGDSITWNSVFVADGTGPPAIELIAPLPAGSETTGALRDAAGAIVGLELSWERDPDGFWRARAIVHQPAPALADVAVLAAPIAAGDAPQRVTFSGPQGFRFIPDPALGIEQYVGYSQSRSLLPSALERGTTLLGTQRHPGELWLMPDSHLAKHGLRGTLRSGSPGKGVALASFAIFATAVGGLVIGYRALSRAAENAHTEALIAAELSRMRAAATSPPSRAWP